MLAQSLAIAVKPWPRALEATISYTSGDELLDHPFAGLAALKRQLPNNARTGWEDLHCLKL